MEDVMRSMLRTDSGAAPAVAFIANARAAWPMRRITAVALLAPVMFALSVAASGGWARAAAPLWTALVALGTLAFGCTPCASVAAVSALASLAVLTSSPHDVPTAILALGIAAFGLRQRLTNPITCAA